MSDFTREYRQDRVVRVIYSISGKVLRGRNELYSEVTLPVGGSDHPAARECSETADIRESLHRQRAE